MDWLREIFGFVEGLSVIRAIAGLILVFFLPGFAWTLVFFKGSQINIVERVVLSFGLSIAVVTISIFALNLLVGVKITGFNSVLIIIVVTVIPVVAYYLNRLVRRRLR